MIATYSYSREVVHVVCRVRHGSIIQLDISCGDGRPRRAFHGLVVLDDRKGAIATIIHEPPTGPADPLPA